MNNIHTQFVNPPARIFFILEDKKLYDQAFWKEILYPNIKQRNLIDLSSLTSYRIRLDCSSANELMYTSDPIPLLSDCISNLRNLIQRYASKQHYGLCRKLEYLLQCLDYCYSIVRSLWTAERGFETIIEISPLSDVDAEKHPLTNPEDYNFQSDMPQLVFWCLDTDGLQLNQKVLNHQNSHVSVKPLRDFIYSEDKAAPKKKKRLRFMQVPQNLSTRRNLSHITKNNGIQNSTDHFIILLHPNAEALNYSMRSESKEKLKRHITNENAVWKKKKTMHGTKVFIGISLLLKNSEVHVQPTFKEGILDLVQQLFLQNDALSHSWNEDDEKEFLKFVRPNADDFNTYERNVLSGSLYIKKDRRGNFPLMKIRTRVKQPMKDLLTVFKWTTSVNKKTVSRIWSEPHRCNGKTKIPLHPDFVSKEILDKYGTNVYGGFKPCQRIVKNKLRCRDHTSDVSHEF